MTVNSLCEKCSFTPVVITDGEREVSGCYIGDLLSWVMGRAEADNAWITIMSNINVVAVASLTDAAVVILAEGVTLEKDVIETAKLKDVNILSSEKPIYETAIDVSQQI